MNILFVVHGLPPWARAGTENYTHYISQALAMAGHDVTVFCRRNEPAAPEYHRFEDMRDGVRVIGINNTTRDGTTYASSYRNEKIDDAFETVARDCGAQAVDIQHLSFLSIGIVDRAKMLGLPVLMSLHDYSLLCPTGQFVKTDTTPCAAQVDAECAQCLGPQLTATAATRKAHAVAQKWVSKNSPIMKALGWLNRARARFAPPGGMGAPQQVRLREEQMADTATKIDRYLSPSAYLKDQLSCIIEPSKIEVSHLGYNYDGCDAPRTKGNRIRFGFIGAVMPWKGLDTLLKAYRQIGPERCEVHAHGRIVPVPDRPDYGNVIDRLLSETGAEYTGEYDQKTVYDLLAQIDVLVVPSTSAENSPLTIQEARAARVPVIASRIGGIPEFVRDEETGLLVEPGSVEALAAAMNRLIEQPELIQKMKDRIQPPRSIEDDARRHIEIYEELLK